MDNHIFGTAVQPVNLTRLAGCTGYSKSTMSRWRQRPGMITLEGLSRMAKALRWTDEQIVAVVRGYNA